MKYLIDTDWIVDFLKGRKDTVKILRSLADEGLCVSLISYGEVYEGIYYGNDPQRHERTFQNFLHGVEVLPLNEAIMRRFAKVRGQLRSRGLLIGDPDILIAATALHYNLILMSNNKRHFNRIDDLKLYDNTQ